MTREEKFERDVRETAETLVEDRGRANALAWADHCMVRDPGPFWRAVRDAIRDTTPIVEGKPMNEAISYEDFCDRAGPLAPTWVDDYDADGLARLLTRAWEACAWIQTLTDERIVRALEEAR